MSLPTAISPAKAQQIVEKIAKDNGWISQTAREQSHQEALDAIDRLQIGLGAAARTLAQNLYRSNARFLFELIQNAEDNNYTRANALGAEPFIKFTIRPNTIIIDCNEDGFTPENVEAICRLGESTKIRTNSQYYIGEKGIGFKSVFMVACKVHIQSGPFTFFFEHEPGNNGMGMITPIWEPSDITLTEPLTRITLTLLDSLDVGDLLLQFDNLPRELLLFMKKLKNIIIDEDVQELAIAPEVVSAEEAADVQEQHGEQEKDDVQEEGDLQEELNLQEEDNETEEDDETEEVDETENDDETEPNTRVKGITTFSCKFDEITGRAAVTVSEELVDETNKCSDEYRITRKILSNLPADEQRDHNTTEVILAFPVLDVDGVDRSYIGPHEVYAFLPIRDFGYPFIIQADFVTQASREDVMENARNKAILQGIAEVFVVALVQFCQQPFLQYEWMNYIPEDDKVSSPFWSGLLTQIKGHIKTTPLLWPQSRSRLRLISQLKIVPSDFRDVYDEPLVPDLPEEELYLDRNYEFEMYHALSKLIKLGLKFMNTHDCIERIGRDAKKSTSKMKSADDDWHERTARVLLKVFDKPFLARKISYLKSLPLVPLVDKRWTSITDGNVFFPDTEDMPIPSDLGLRLIDRSAIRNATRKTLFSKLGVVDAHTGLVRKLILEKHQKRWDEITLKLSANHLRYLYWTQPPQPASGLSNHSLSLRKSSPFCLFNDFNVSVDGDHDLYFETDQEYGAKDLLRIVREETPPKDSQGFGSLIHSEYLKSAPRQNNDTVLTSFEDWLAQDVLVLRHPRLMDPKNPTQLSKLFLFIIEKHPEKMLGTLKAHWKTYSEFIECHTPLKQKISDVMVPSTNIGKRELCRTFLPLKELESRCSEFLEPRIFPFLKFNDNSRVEEWKFIEMFGVGVESNPDFCLEILRQLKKSQKPFSYKIYEEMQRKIWVSTDQVTDIERVQDAIYEEDLIHVPSYYDWAQPRWTWTTACIWNGPKYMREKYSLLPALSDVNNATLTAFFVDTLQLKDVSYSDLTDELASIKTRSQADFENVKDIYTRLQTMALSLSAAELEILRALFEDNALVYDISHKTWALTSSCLWSKDAQIPGKVAILKQYADLKDFFVGTLKVKIPDLGMLVDELSKVASSKLTVHDVKSLIWQINSFSPPRKALEKLKNLPIFPVKAAGSVLNPAVLRARNDKFSIIDRQPWADVFQSRIDLLDFNLEEVRKLHTFFSSFDLENYYLSRAVTETSLFKGEVGEQSRKRTRQLRGRAYAMGQMCCSL